MEAKLRGKPLPRRAVPACRSAFSLIELLIAMVILAIGLTMVATMFPVAWTRARGLAEHTTHETVRAAAHNTVKSLTRVTGQPPLNASSFAGDLAYNIADRLIYFSPGNWPSGTDSWVHALNLENVQVEDRRFVDEDPWKIERAPNLASAGLDMWPEAVERSYVRRQVRFHQRIHPPMEARDPATVDDLGVFVAPDRQWDDALDTRRYAWAAFHRISSYIPDAPNAAGATRSFDMYYVTLRRPQPTYRYARQDPSSTAKPWDLAEAPVVPAARPSSEDLMFPVPWRVQIEFRGTPPLASRANPSGIPSEVVVPPLNLQVSPQVGAMLVQMFPSGARFIDEVSGEVYRVVRRRITGPLGEEALLTLDREVFVEDLDLADNDARCDPNREGTLDDCERLRTVWIFPPPVEATRVGPGKDILVFQGSQPVVDIQVRSLNVFPSE
jgi:prepilin-type N-terminal cleavage/methylation domain-containing protein